MSSIYLSQSKYKKWRKRWSWVDLNHIIIIDREDITHSYRTWTLSWLILCINLPESWCLNCWANIIRSIYVGCFWMRLASKLVGLSKQTGLHVVSIEPHPISWRSGVTKWLIHPWIKENSSADSFQVWVGISTTLGL